MGNLEVGSLHTILRGLGVFIIRGGDGDFSGGSPRPRRRALRGLRSPLQSNRGRPGPAGRVPVREVPFIDIERNKYE